MYEICFMFLSFFCILKNHTFYLKNMFYYNSAKKNKELGDGFVV